MPKIRRGVVLAGGTGTRMLPLTKVTNKHLLPVGPWPMIRWPILRLSEAGVKDILIVTGVEHMDAMIRYLGSGSECGCNFTYKVQDNAGGIAQALYLAADFAQSDPIAVMLGDNIFNDNLRASMDLYKAKDKGAMVHLFKVKDPQRFGVAEIKDNRIVSVEEKPKEPKSDLAVTGLYYYDKKVFDYIAKCQFSNRGELEITDVNNFYINDDHMYYNNLTSWWSDAGTMPSYQDANRLAWEEAGK